MENVKPITSPPAHVFLTGAVGAGKSTALRRSLAGLAGPFGGFQTFFDAPREQAGRVLYMRGIGAPREAAEGCAVARFGPEGARPDSAAFDRLGVALLRGDAALLVMDECGRLERDALLFQRAVLDALDGTIPILGVLRQDAHGWLDDIRAHPRVRVLTVTEENRDAAPGLLIAHFAGGGNVHGG